MSVREEIAAGRLRGEALLERLLAVPFVDRDGWLDAALGFEELPDDVDLPRGAVPYLPCGVDEILAMVREVPLTEDAVLVDLGSGLGRVVILAHLLSGATALGLEIQAALVERARACCGALKLNRISFECCDVAERRLDGSVFFLYAPFNGELLARVLVRLREVAGRRKIVVCAVGLELGEVEWLKERNRASLTLAIYDSV